MADKQVDDTAVVDEITTEEASAPEVVFDKEIEIMGDVTPNPAIEEAEETEETEAEDETTEAEETETTTTEEAEESDESDETEATTQPAEVVEKDETGVYDSQAVADPGDFQPKKDYSFEVTTTNGKTVKISSQAQADAFAERLDSEDGLVSASQFAKFTRSMARMDLGIERERADYEAEKEQYELQQAQQAVRNDQITQWNNEINYLRTKGELPAITPELNSANWSDPKNAEEPAIKEALAIFKWMETENAARRSAGIGEVSSAVDAHRLMKSEQAIDTANTDRKRETSERQARGKRVSGSSPYIESNTPNNAIIGEGGSLNDLLLEAQMGA